MRPDIQNLDLHYALTCPKSSTQASLIKNPVKRLRAWIKTLFEPRYDFYDYQQQRKFELELEILRSKHPRQF